MVASVETNAKHYLDLMARAVDKVMPDATREIKYAKFCFMLTHTNSYLAIRTMYWMF